MISRRRRRKLNATLYDDYPGLEVVSPDAAQTVVDLLPALVAHTGGAPEDVVGVDGALDGDAVVCLLG
jgi:hypothetical protein